MTDQLAGRAGAFSSSIATNYRLERELGAGGTRVAVVNGPSVAVVTVDGSAPERIIRLSDSKWTDPLDWTVDGMIYYLLEPTGDRLQWQLWRVALDGERRERVPTDAGDVLDVRVSPDGRWLAWESDASGRREVYLGRASGGTTPGARPRARRYRAA